MATLWVWMLTSHLLWTIRDGSIHIAVSSSVVSALISVYEVPLAIQGYSVMVSSPIQYATCPVSATVSTPASSPVVIVDFLHLKRSRI